MQETCRFDEMFSSVQLRFVSANLLQEEIFENLKIEALFEDSVFFSVE